MEVRYVWVVDLSARIQRVYIQEVLRVVHIYSVKYDDQYLPQKYDDGMIWNTEWIHR